ncbi:DUF4292 domain-containing protein [Carboxylicivirga sp. M1479]|uniref:DUF4292 domain-containing protein n=1 Tax=Carboxylicivirga sp. M1479 TaxID=2594476 RepID=UPI00117806FD|nr:DUF4292 domain-containing protein [Carboxylicivirga sp. M1479]TRX71660.1 DUF4292 domain-containing protein [Carboxylicivirga sp. M1479]
MRKLVVVILALITLAGCKTSHVYYTKKGELRNISDSKLFSSVEEQYLDYESLFYKKFKADVELPNEDYSFKGNLYLLKDSSIVVSILMGIEWYRVRLTETGVEIIDRRKKTYTQGDYKLLWDKFMIELDYYTLQRIITNELFTYPISIDQDRFIKKYKHYCSNDLYQFQSVREGKYSRKYKKEKVDNILFHQFSILPEVFKISEVYIKDFGVNSQVKITYHHSLSDEKTLLPSVLDINGERGTEAFKLHIEFDNIEVNGTNSIGFKVSSKYKKLYMNNED